MLNEKLKELRLSFKLSQVELAKELNVTKQCISNWENDNILPSIEMLITIAKFFHVSPNYLLGFDDKEYIDVSNLTSNEIAHIRLLIEDLENKN